MRSLTSIDHLSHLYAELEGLTDDERGLVHCYIVGAASCYVPDADWVSIVDRAIHRVLKGEPG